MATIHPTSVVEPSAQIAEGVVIGPYCYIENGAVIGQDTRLESHVTVRKDTKIGERNVIAQGAILGGDPQDRKYAGQQTFLEIGNDNVIREYVTIHRSSKEGEFTRVGDRNYLMAFVHLGHDVTVTNDVTITNNVGIAGHATIEEMVTIGGMAGVHQFARIGKLAMVGGMTRVVRDVPPFMIVEGHDQDVRDINAVGLRRIGVKPEARMALHKACKLLFRSQLALGNAMEIVQREVMVTPEIEYLLAFLERLYKGKNGRGDQR